MKRFILIDAYALIHRAYHALPPLTTKSGEIVNAVFGFTSIFIRVIKEFKPDYVAAAFDLPEPTFRHKEYKEYKATRKEAPPDLYPQVPIVKKVLNAFDVPIYEKSGFEADDIIGTISQKLKGKSVEVLILTGDMDTLQLVGGNIKVYTPKRGLSDTVIYDEKKVVERFEGLKPEQLADFKGLRGDPSDNIPGVKGVGEKTAITLLNRYKTIEKLYDAIEKNKAEGISPAVLEKLKNGEKAAFFSKKLATLDLKVPIEFNLKRNEFGKFDKIKLVEFFKELGFVTLIERLKLHGEQGMLAMPSAAHKINYFKVPQNISFEKLNQELKKANDIYLSYRLNSKSELDAVVLESNGRAYYLNSEFFSIKDVLESEEIRKTGHDFKALIRALFKEKITLRGLDFDTMIAAYILNPGEREYSLNKLSIKEFGESVPEEVIHSLVFESDLLKRLKPVLLKNLKSTETERVFYEIEMPLIPVLAKMETVGIKLDGGKLEKISSRLRHELGNLEKEIYKLAGEKFNINSPMQLAEILFFKLKIPGARAGGRIKKTKGGALSTNAAELEKLRPQHKIIDFILRYRELNKLKTTYTDTLPTLVDEENRIHTTFNQAGTATGRLSSQDPNLQNIPAHSVLSDEVRKAFIAERGFKLLSVDYSQIHLRIIAALANDKKMIAAFEKGLDIHKFTASEINNVSLEEVTPQMRFAAKELNFGIIYGMGVQSFAEAAKISKEKAQSFIDEYMKDFSGVARYIEELKKQAQEKGFAATLFGRRRYLPELKSLNYMLRSQAERIAINMPIQGLEADIMKKAMIEIDKWLRGNDNIRMILQVHDELLFEVKTELVKEAAEKIVELMESVIKLKVPITAEAKIGDNWGELMAFPAIDR
ncbi:MAG: DNA polymerase I [Candidatus Azambacteria bacterium]|nr:DNA polymerase I [Candidatus Azambacteria bacterium]